MTAKAVPAAMAAKAALAAMAAMIALTAGLAAPDAHAQAGVDAEGPPAELRPAPPPPRILEEERARGAEAPSAEAPSRQEPPSSAGTTGAPQGITDTGLAPALAAPRDDGADDLDEVLVVGTPMRLPDLGSALRAQREAEEGEGRIAVTFLPLYDPEAERGGIDDPLFRNRELERVGFIELFRIRFGHRSRK